MALERPAPTLARMAPPLPGVPQVLTVPEVARALRVHKATVYRLLGTGKLRAICVGADRRVPLEELRRFIDDQLAPAAPRIHASRARLRP